MNTKALAEALRAVLQSHEEPNAAEAPVPEEIKALLAEYDADASTQRDHYHLIFGEVIYRDNAKRHDVKGTKVNIFTKAPDLLFPSRRLSHIQNAMAMQAREEVGQPKFFDVAAVNILAMHYLGQFTDNEFYAGIQSETVDVPAPQADGSNVVGFPPKA